MKKLLKGIFIFILIVVVLAASLCCVLAFALNDGDNKALVTQNDIDLAAGINSSISLLGSGSGATFELSIKNNTTDIKASVQINISGAADSREYELKAVITGTETSGEDRSTVNETIYLKDGTYYSDEGGVASALAGSDYSIGGVISVNDMIDQLFSGANYINKNEIWAQRKIVYPNVSIKPLAILIECRLSAKTGSALYKGEEVTVISYNALTSETVKIAVKSWQGFYNEEGSIYAESETEVVYTFTGYTGSDIVYPAGL